jgi:hypothetical protein
VTGASQIALRASDKRRYRLRLLFLPPVIAVAATLSVAAPSQAAGSGPIFGLEALDPPQSTNYFVYDSGPGDRLVGRVRVSNTGDRTGPLLMYGTDGTTGQTSGVVFVEGSDPQLGVGSWIKTEVRRITLAPRESTVVAFSVDVPARAEPGQWVGGIVAENLTQSAPPTQTEASGVPTPEPSSGLIVKFRALSIVAVQVNVRGPLRPGMVVTGVRTGGTQGHQNLLISMGNTGNTMEKPTGTIDVTTADGSPLQHLAFAMDTVLPRTAIDYPVAVRHKAMGVGCYLTSVALNYGTAESEKYSGRFCVSEEEIDQQFPAVSALARPAAPSATNSTALVIAAAASVVLVSGGLIWLVASRRRRVPVPI